jgi:hypothetical protein
MFGQSHAALAAFALAITECFRLRKLGMTLTWEA